VALGSGHLLQVNGVDREVIDALTVAHNDIIVRFRCKISVFRRECQTRIAGIVQ
jgi:hypothetical protein